MNGGCLVWEIEPTYVVCVECEFEIQDGRVFRLDLNKLVKATCDYISIVVGFLSLTCFEF